MLYLFAVSLLWGFSFGLVKAEFGGLSGPTLAAMRLLIALPFFLPFLKAPFRKMNALTGQLMLIGGLQYGLMYVCLFSSFRYLSGYEVALLTIFTPLYVIAADALLQRRVPPAWFWWTALLAVMGALWIFHPRSLPQKWPGIFLMQLANICFACGQVAWRIVRLRMAPHTNNRDCFALLYAGGFLIAAAFALFTDPLREVAQLDRGQWGALLYLGAIASGLGFFLWNAGAIKVNPATLAVFNNLKIPLATVIAIVVFGEAADPGTLLPGLLVMLLALAWAEIAHRRRATRNSPG